MILELTANGWSFGNIKTEHSYVQNIEKLIVILH